MRIDEMRDREDYDGVLADTLADGWSRMFGKPHQVSGPNQGQAWRLQALLGGYCVSHVAREPRQFLVDGFRYTRRTHRAIPQWIAGTMLGTQLGIRLSSVPAFGVTPAIEHAEKMLVVPGNQRIRIFDFQRGLTRVMSKRGFPQTGMKREVEVRSGLGPFPPLLDAAPDAAWFDEPILEAVSLARLPPWLSYRRVEADALAALDEFMSPTVESVAANDYVDARRDTLLGLSARLRELVPESAEALMDAVDALSRGATRLGRVEVAIGHGDLQPGNIMVGRSGERVWLIDWEHSARRFCEYDRMVYALASRSGGGVAERLVGFVEGRTQPQLGELSRDRGARRALACLFLLEETVWHAKEACTGPFRVATQGLSSLIQRVAIVKNVVAGD